MKKLFSLLSAFCLTIASFDAAAQRQKIAIFAPLYLDSAFNFAGNYRFNNTFPKFLNPGVEFYQGVQMALDSLQKTGAPLEVFVYDTKSRATAVDQKIRSAELADVDLVIGHSNPYETRQLASFAQSKKIPFVSATLPNDAGVSNNPYFVVLNTTLQGHIEGLYRLLQKSNSLDNIILFSRSGQQEDAIKSHFTEYGKTTASVPLKIKVVAVGETFTPAKLAPHLDSTRRNVIIAGSMEESFGRELAKNLASFKGTYPVTLVGMPTWDNFNFNLPEFKTLDILYSTPFYYARMTPLESRIAAAFEKEIGSRPTDNFFRGYETVLRFGQLLIEKKADLVSSLSTKGAPVFTRLDIQPVFKDKRSMVLDFFENKNLYFVRVTAGNKRLL